jgi:drug/metabolite transporter (DMT)-like permease
MVHFRNRAAVFQVALLSMVFTVAIILGNASLRYIPVSFNQAIGATTPLFTAVLSFLLLGNIESLGTYLALIPVVLGIIIATGFEPSFHMMGFLMCATATGLRGFKSVFQVWLSLSTRQNVCFIHS